MTKIDLTVCPGCGAEEGIEHLPDCSVILDRDDPFRERVGVVGTEAYMAEQDETNRLMRATLDATASAGPAEDTGVFDEPEFEEEQSPEDFWREEANRNAIDVQRLNRRVGLLETMVSAYVQRQAGELVARGVVRLIDAPHWADAELVKINGQLAALEAGQG